MSQAELSEGILSKAQLSKFERDLTKISVDKFLALLERLHVTFTEFGNALAIQERLYEQAILERTLQKQLSITTKTRRNS